MNTAELLSLSTDYLRRKDNLKRDDILTLRDVIREHNRLYHQDEAPVISDTEYDELFHALARAESDYDMFDESSPTARLAILASEQFQKVRHQYPMISLDNTYSVDEVREWNERMLRILRKENNLSHREAGACPVAERGSDPEKQKGIPHSITHPNLPNNPPLSSTETVGHLPLTGELWKGGDQEQFNYYVQPKYDGLGLAVIYEYGRMVQAVTRGSGVEGEDVTLTALEIENLPKDIPALRDTERMEVRGEVMMSRTVFEAVNRERLAKGDKLFANPRNCASGSLRQLDPLVTRARHLQFFAYAIPQIEQGNLLSSGGGTSATSDGGLAVSGNPEHQSSASQAQQLLSQGAISSYSDMMDLLSSWGFEREDFEFKSVSGIDELCRIITRETNWYLGQSKQYPPSPIFQVGTEPSNHQTIKPSNYFDFDIDGMVLKLDDMMLWDDLGRTEHHPRYAIAYKFPAKQVRTKVLSIEHSVGRTGTVTPVANLEAVDVGGVVVRRATLHNYDELCKKGVREGDYVFIMRAGEVIPEIVSVITEVRTGDEKVIEIPAVCPVCATGLEQDEGKVAIWCPNPHCPAKVQGQLEMFVSKQGMNIDGLGVKQVELFLELGWITDFASIYELESHRDEILTLEGYKEKSVQNLIEALEKSRHTTLERVLTAIGIPNVGKKTAKIITSSVIASNNAVSVASIPLGGGTQGGLVSEKTEQLSTESLPDRGASSNLIEALFTITEEELLSMKDIGPETARAFVEYMQSNREFVERLFSKLDIQVPETRLLRASQGQEQGKLAGKSFCVTGSFDSISRDEIHELVEKNGGEVRSSVTGKLDYLIVGDNAGSKKSKAEELGVQILTIDGFQSMIGK